jgi:hypothetical protein
MTSATHTPGPWRRQLIAPHFDRISIQTADGKHAIATVWVSKADARLIAAAPDLLAALDQVDAYLSPFDGEEDAYAEIRSVIQQAIAKAKGE